MTTREEFEAWRDSEDARRLFMSVEGAQWVAWRASRKAALEEAAKECDLMQESWERDMNNLHISESRATSFAQKADAAEQCAMGIRALKGE